MRSIGRLDKDTSGVLLFGKHGVSAAKLCRQREEQIYQRWYLALAWGKFRKKTGKLTGKIAPCPGEKKKMAVTVDGKTSGDTLSGTLSGGRICAAGLPPGNGKNPSDSCTYGPCGASAPGRSDLRKGRFLPASYAPCMESALRSAIYRGSAGNLCACLQRNGRTVPGVDESAAVGVIQLFRSEKLSTSMMSSKVHSRTSIL